MMGWNEYQVAAMRTKADQQLILDRICRLGPPAMQLDNAVTGLSDEVGELNAAKKKWIEYGQELDKVNIKEEVGDCLWRLAQICDALDLSLQECAEGNLKKLAKRYPEKYTDLLAAEANRNREVEREALVQNGNGWAEPPEEKEEPRESVPKLHMWLAHDDDGVYLFVNAENTPPEIKTKDGYESFLWPNYKSNYQDYFYVSCVEDQMKSVLPIKGERIKVALQFLEDSPESTSSFYIEKCEETDGQGIYSLHYDGRMWVSSVERFSFEGIDDKVMRTGEVRAVRFVAVEEGK